MWLKRIFFLSSVELVYTKLYNRRQSGKMSSFEIDVYNSREKWKFKFCILGQSIFNLILKGTFNLTLTGTFIGKQKNCHILHRLETSYLEIQVS